MRRSASRSPSAPMTRRPRRRAPARTCTYRRYAERSRRWRGPRARCRRSRGRTSESARGRQRLRRPLDGDGARSLGYLPVTARNKRLRARRRPQDRRDRRLPSRSIPGSARRRVERRYNGAPFAHHSCFAPHASSLRAALSFAASLFAAARRCAVPATAPPPLACRRPGAVGGRRRLARSPTSPAARRSPPRNADERRDPASLTKLMTAYLVFGALRAKTIVPSQMVDVSRSARGRPKARACSSSRAARCRSTSSCAA